MYPLAANLVRSVTNPMREVPPDTSLMVLAISHSKMPALQVLNDGVLASARCPRCFASSVTMVCSSASTLAIDYASVSFVGLVRAGGLVQGRRWW